MLRMAFPKAVGLPSVGGSRPPPYNPFPVRDEPTLTPLRVPGRAPRVLTIDAEDWFHVCGDGYYSDPRRWEGFVPRIETTLTALLDALDRGRHRATIFVLGWIARRYPKLVAEAARRGHEIGVHGDLHQRADEMSPEEFRQDLLRARESVEAAAGVPSMSYRAAEWSIRESGAAALRILAAEGFACDASMMPVPPLGPSDGSSGPCRIAGDGWALTEIPPLTGRAFGRRLPMGGAWPFRVLSAKRLAEAEEAFRAEGLPAVFTLHPWEIDPAHPAMEGLSPLARTVHFLGLSGWPDRLRRWLEQERCVALSDVLPHLEPA
jgi:polysaccharide deacetylase family protein (PEP-CTERM system associated)